MVATDMENEVVGIGLARRMAVDAHSRHLSILNDCTLIEIVKSPLIQSHVTIHLISRSNASIGQSIVFHIVFAHIHLKVAIACPPTITLGTYSKGKFSALIACHKTMPVVKVEVGIFTLHMHFAPFTALDDNIHLINIALNIEVHRSNRCRYRNSHIVWKYRRHLIRKHRIIHRLRTRYKKRNNQYPNICEPFFIN